MTRQRPAGRHQPHGHTGWPTWRLAPLVVGLVAALVGLGVPGVAHPAVAAGPAAGPAPGWTWPITPGGRHAVVRTFAPGLARWDAGHRGVDLAGTVGAPVGAAAAGVVLFAGHVAGKPVVVVGHGQLRTTYEPVRAAVAVGKPVTAGQLLGRLVADFSHCVPAACLHLGLRRGDAYLDPLGVLRFQVRLLPLTRQAGGAAVPGGGRRLWLG